MELKDGIYSLIGVDEVEVPTGWYDYNGETSDGIAICLDGVTYVAYADPDDGYRSYGCFEPSNIEIHNTFPPQKVRLTNIEWDGCDEDGWRSAGSIIKLSNPTDNSTILEVGTDHSDSYYPYSIFSWHPENLPINKK